MKKITMSALLAASLCIGFAACDSPKKETDSAEVAEEQNEAKMATDDGEDDADFLVKAASGGMLEVQLGQMAQEKASSQSVKDFGKQMVTDHTKANEELKALAAQKNITLPTTVSNDHQEHIDKLAKLSGTEFDEEYMQLMTKDHHKDVALFEEAAEDAKDPDIKAFAAKTLPTLKTHMQMAEQKKDLAEDRDKDGTAKNQTSADSRTKE